VRALRGPAHEQSVRQQQCSQGRCALIAILVQTSGQGAHTATGSAKRRRSTNQASMRATLQAPGLAAVWCADCRVVSVLMRAHLLLNARALALLHALDGIVLDGLLFSALVHLGVLAGPELLVNAARAGQHSSAEAWGGMGRRGGPAGVGSGAAAERTDSCSCWTPRRSGGSACDVARRHIMELRLQELLNCPGHKDRLGIDQL